MVTWVFPVVLRMNMLLSSSPRLFTCPYENGEFYSTNRDCLVYYRCVNHMLWSGVCFPWQRFDIHSFSCRRYADVDCNPEYAGIWRPMYGDDEDEATDQEQDDDDEGEEAPLSESSDSGEPENGEGTGEEEPDNDVEPNEGEGALSPNNNDESMNKPESVGEEKKEVMQSLEQKGEEDTPNPSDGDKNISDELPGNLAVGGQPSTESVKQNDEVTSPTINAETTGDAKEEEQKVPEVLANGLGTSEQTEHSVPEINCDKEEENHMEKEENEPEDESSSDRVKSGQTKFAFVLEGTGLVNKIDNDFTGENPLPMIAQKVATKGFFGFSNVFGKNVRIAKLLNKRQAEDGLAKQQDSSGGYWYWCGSGRYVYTESQQDQSAVCQQLQDPEFVQEEGVVSPNSEWAGHSFLGSQVNPV